MSQKDQLAIPDAARKDARSFELLRVWVASEDQHVSLRAGVWKEPGPWGTVLADLAGHIANAISETEGISREDALDEIEAAFLDELERPTGEPSGEIG
jgi:hypothetical protein